MSGKKDRGAPDQKLDGEDGEIVMADDAAGPVKLDDAAQALIGHHLRALYGEIVREPVPDHLIKLLQDLERKEREK